MRTQGGRGTRQLEFIRFRSADGERIRVLPELPEGGEIYQYISELGEALSACSGSATASLPFRRLNSGPETGPATSVLQSQA